MVVAAGSIVAIVAATWAAGVPTGGETPLSPADSPTQHGPSAPSSPGVVGPPLSDHAIPPGSPLSPGLPGNTSSVERSPRGSADASAPPRRHGSAPQGKAKGHSKHKARGRAIGHRAAPRLMAGAPQLMAGHAPAPSSAGPPEHANGNASGHSKGTPPGHAKGNPPGHSKGDPPGQRHHRGR